MKPFGPTFATELEAAGLLGLPFSWGEDGAIEGRDNLTAEQQAALDAIIAAHDPTAIVPAPDPVEKLREFLAANPDVAALF